MIFQTAIRDNLVYAVIDKPDKDTTNKLRNKIPRIFFLLHRFSLTLYA